MFIDYMLKFDSKEQAESFLLGAGYLQDYEGKLFPGPGKNVDIIGTIYKPLGTYQTTEEGFRIPDMEAVDGYHVNVRNTVADPALDAHSVTPSTPHRVWA